MNFEKGPYRGPAVLAVLWALECLSFVVVLLRVYCKRCISRACGWDDGMICVSLALHLAAGGLYTKSVTMGVAGRHIDELKDPSKMIEGMVLFATAQTVGTVCLSLSKTSFAISLIRISPCHNMKCFLCFLIFSLNFVMLGCSSIYLLQCQPIGAIWDASLRSTATCWPQGFVTGLATTSHTYSGIVDLILAIIPWPWIWRLRMRKRDKIGIGMCMSLGVCATGTAFMKAFNQHTIPKIKDFTYFAYILIIMAAVEESVTIMASSMPTLRVLFVRMRDSHHRPSSFSFVKHSTLIADRPRQLPFRVPGSKKRTENTWELSRHEIQIMTMQENNSEQRIMNRQTPESSIRREQYTGGGGEEADLCGSPSGYSAEVQKV